MRKTYLPFFLIALWLPSDSSAQQTVTKHYKWDIGLQGGMAQGQNDMNSFGPYENNLGGGLLVRYHLDDMVALRANLLYADISGNDANYSNRTDRGFRFSAPVYEGSLVAELDILGKRRWNKEGKFHRIVSPYLLIGGGYMYSTPSVNYNETFNLGLRDRIEEDKAAVRTGRVVMPIGLGMKVDLNESWALGLEAGLRVMFDDYSDGVSNSGNPRKNDTYSLLALNLNYRFPHVQDSDRDGVPDKSDACPTVKGGAATKGCPDTDEDGIADQADACPDTKGTVAMQGCPDSDGDGLSDKSDQCPDEKGTIATGGCPDKDKDGIADAKDECPDQYGPSKFKGCPDSDGDGLKDSEDKCPNEAGTADNMGCPLNDRDRDGVKDSNDKCPDQAGKAEMSGCPDTDTDGVADPVDRCPTEAGPATNLGCPTLAEADKKVLADAIYGVQFEPAKAVLKASSNAILDQVATVMAKYPAYNLDIDGHTDSDGSEASNQKLSENRAKACYDYLLAKGITANRMKYQGFGESRPVAANNSKENKAKNRRVEFMLHL